MTRLISKLGLAPLIFAFGLIAGGALMGTALAVTQPHMQNALSALQTAQYELSHANADKGGHRDAALNSTNQAIQQVRQGIQYANYYHR
ncbi:MAG: hypothetical protein WCD38_12810 [Candidatus Tumulicola sp.]